MMNTAEKILLAARISEAIRRQAAQEPMELTIFGVLSEEKLNIGTPNRTRQV